MLKEAVDGEIEKDHQIAVDEIGVDEAGESYDLWKVPGDASTVHIVKIGDLDATPCVGEHVSHTLAIGRFRVKSYTMKEENVVRIWFMLEDSP